MTKKNGAFSRIFGSDLDDSLPWLMFVGGLIVVIASLALAVESYQRLKNPAYVPVCNLNPVLSCTSVADSQQGHVFGIPNYLLGIAGYSMISALGLALLAGAKFKKWLWRGIQAGAIFAFLFMTWLQYESLYDIGSLCIFCMVLWAFTGPLFWYVTLFNLRQGNINLPKKYSRLSAFLQKHHGDILVLWFLIIFALILKRFWYYWSSLI